MNEHEKDSPREDEFRRRLKDLGYLANPLDKFFIGGAHGRTGVLVANLKIALKVGVLGGVFLGVVTAIGLSLLSPELLGGLWTVARLAVYFSAIFAVFFAALQLVICLFITVLGRLFRRLFTRTEMIALYSGIFAALVVLVYATLWWWTQAGGGELLSAGTAAAFLVIALVAGGTLVLTRLAVTAFLALLGGADLAARGKGRATRLYVAALAAGILIFAGYRLATRTAVPETPSEYSVEYSPMRVTLIAVDGASLDFFDLACEKGLAPNLRALAQRGCLAPLAPPRLNVNPAVWTTVATGVNPEKHGVTSYSAQEIPGLGFYISDRTGFGLYDALLASLPAVGLSKRAPLERRGFAYPALWDVLAQKGDLSGVVDWWGTWPARDFHGCLVTDRMYPKLQVARTISEKPRFEEEVYPRELFDRLVDYPLSGAKISEDPFEAARDMDTFAVAALLSGMQDYTRLSLASVYLPGLDIFENALYGTDTEGWNMAETARMSDSVLRYWGFLDGLLEPLLSAAGTSDTIIVVADPGMLKPPERRLGRRTSRGFAVISGGPARQVRLASPLEPVDIAPAALYLLGFPVSAEMDGRVPLEAFTEAYANSHPVKSVETFGRVKVTSPTGYSVDSELVDRLKSLGYLQ